MATKEEAIFEPTTASLIDCKKDWLYIKANSSMLGELNDEAPYWLGKAYTNSKRKDYKLIY
jgi:hypothetical protein